MPPTLHSSLRVAVRGSAELALTVGAILLLFAFYLLVWSNQRTAVVQGGLLDEFRAGQSGVSDSRQPDPGDGIAVLHSPALGDDWEWVVVEGIDDADLRNGPGRFTETAMPGEIGNFAIAGHRATHGEPFAELDRLEVGDEVVVETAEEWLVYQVTWSRILPPNATHVLAPVSGHPDAEPTQSTMTLVTCHPRWGSSERLVVGTQLVERRAAAAGPPDIIA